MRKRMRDVEKLREDIMWVAGKMQNEPDVFAKALDDGDTLKEYRRLVGDLFSLTEVVVDDAYEADKPKGGN